MAALKPHEFARILGSVEAPPLPGELPVLVWGPPGIGKSSIVREVFETRGYAVRDVRLAQIDETELFGLPRLVEDGDGQRVSYTRPWIVPDGSVPTVLFLDELNRASRRTLAAALSLILDRRVGDWPLPDNTIVIGACNPGIDLDPALANRFCHLVLATDYDSWREWAVATGVHAAVLTFLDSQRQWFVGEPRPESPSFCTPRTWHAVSTAMTRYSGTSLRHVVRGLLGEPAASAFLAFLDARGGPDSSLPPVSAILGGTAEPPPADLSPAASAMIVDSILAALGGNYDPEALGHAAAWVAGLGPAARGLFLRRVLTSFSRENVMEVEAVCALARRTRLLEPCRP